MRIFQEILIFLSTQHNSISETYSKFYVKLRLLDSYYQLNEHLKGFCLQRSCNQIRNYKHIFQSILDATLQPREIVCFALAFAPYIQAFLRFTFLSLL